jgi:hypothetical protein
MPTLGQIAIKVRTLSLEDSVGKAAEAVHLSTVGAVPVFGDHHLVGLVTPRVLRSFIVGDGSIDPRPAVVADLDLEPALALPSGLNPREGLLLLQANDIEQAPVVTPTGMYVGMVTAAELGAAVYGRMRPPLIGGMATPFGVYLTGGGARGGVGDLALVTTGAFMTLVALAASVLTGYLVSHGGAADSIPAISQWLDNGLRGELEKLVWILLFAGLFRLSWIGGYHAAEHQVVHTLEAGDDLRPDVVREKPRVHPRCGTNLVVAVGIMSTFWQMRTLDVVQPILAMLVTAFLWRRIGGWVQQHVTTRPASPEQIRSGIHAAEQLLERYQRHPVQSLGLRRRIWNMGLLQVLSGSLLVTALLALLQLVVPLPSSLRVF